MSKTLLTGVNDVLKRVSIVQGATAPVTSFTNSALQTDIDIVIQLWRECVAQLQSDGVVPNEVTEGSVTLVTGTREYSLATDFVEMSGSPGYGAVFKCVAKNRIVVQYESAQGEDAYIEMYAAFVDPSRYVGDPNTYAISPKALKVMFDQTPGSAQNGDVYLYLYDTYPTLAATTDVFPFLDVIYDALVPVVSELYTNRREGVARDAISAMTGYNRALDLSNRTKPRRSYGRRVR